MKAALLLACLAALLLAGCGGDTYDSVVGKKVSILEDIATLLEGVENEADAVEAAPRLEALISRLQDATEELKALPEPPTEEKQRVLEAYRQPLAAAGRRVAMATAALVTKPKALAILAVNLELLRRVQTQ